MSSAEISIFLPEINNFCYIKKYRYRLHFDTQFLIVLTFLESLKVVLINVVAILMVSAKLATLDLLLKKVFLEKVKTSYLFSMTSPTKFYQVTQIILYMWLCDQSLITLAFL